MLLLSDTPESERAVNDRFGRSILNPLDQRVSRTQREVEDT